MTFKEFQKKLKPYGMHHGWQVMAAIAVSLLWSDGVIMAYCAGTWFFSKEVSESMHREWSNNPLVIAKNIEWMDFITSCLIAALFIGWVMYAS